jgi:hypothetical protein
MGTLLAGKDAITGSKDPKLGLVAIAIQWRADTIEEAINGPIPSIGLDGLVENQPRKFSVRASGTAGGYDVTSIIEGHQTPTAADGEEFEIQGTTSEDKIETHPDLELLLQNYEGSQDSQTGKAKWPKTIGGYDVRNRMHGVESYLVPGQVWTRKWVSTQLERGYMRRLGTIDTPPGNPPPLEGNENWLLVRITGTWRGNIWLFTASWLRSGPDGWVPEIYRQRA